MHTMGFSLGSWSGRWNEQNDGGASANANANANEDTLMYLNVYDLTPLNNYLYWFGLGIFHSGIEVHGMEYGFGAHDYPSSGVFEVEPKNCPGFVFRKSILVGTTDMPHSEFQSFMQRLASKYHGDTYHLIAKNCNHFTNEVSVSHWEIYSRVGESTCAIGFILQLPPTRTYSNRRCSTAS